MAQVLIRVQDRGLGKPASFSAGDVVWVGSDDHVFSPAELIDPFRVVKIPGLAVSGLRHLLLPVTGKRRASGFGRADLRLLVPGEVNVLTRADTWALFDRMEAR